MYIEITDTIAIIIALTTSTTLVITTAIRNAKLTRALRDLTVPSKQAILMLPTEKCLKFRQKGNYGY